jgi:hypothetical protein
MAEEKKRKGKARKGARKKLQASGSHVDIQLAPAVEFLQGHLSGALCAEVFRDVRTTERQRKWSLFALARFWLAVVLAPPPTALSDLLERADHDGSRGLLPMVKASAQAIFDRAKSVSSTFFAQIYARFVKRIRSNAPTLYCSELAHLDEKFAQILAIDGSRLDKIAHRLKLLRFFPAVFLRPMIFAGDLLRNSGSIRMLLRPSSTKRYSRSSAWTRTH